MLRYDSRDGLLHALAIGARGGVCWTVWLGGALVCASAVPPRTVSDAASEMYHALVARAEFLDVSSDEPSDDSARRRAYRIASADMDYVADGIGLDFGLI